jgi:hypothetical protein
VGLRPGEVCGLRMGDLEFINEGVIRVAHSNGGPLNEDKRGEGKVKWDPCARGRRADPEASPGAGASFV